MKKVFLFLAVVAAVASMSSCKKDCTCVTTMNGEVIQTVTMQAAKCSDLNVTQTMGDIIQEVKCE